jgi:hypothetical protein
MTNMTLQFPAGYIIFYRDLLREAQLRAANCRVSGVSLSISFVYVARVGNMVRLTEGW